MSKAKCKDRIFIDWLRNQRSSTAVLPYSARARAGGTNRLGFAAMKTAHPFTIGDEDRL